MEPQQPSYDPNAANSNPSPTPNPAPAPVDSSMQSPAVTSPAAAPIAAVSAAPSTWPGAFKMYKTSKEAVRLNIGTIACLILISIAVSILAGMLFKDEISFVGDIISIIVSSLLTVASILTYLAGVRGQKLGLGEAFSKSVPFWLAAIALSILTALILGLSFLLLIVPFFFVFPRLVLAPYYLVDHKQGVIEALKTSWEKSTGHVGKVYGIIGANIAMALLALTIIGIPFAVYFLIMFSAVTALLFDFVNKQADSPSAPVA